MLRPKKQETKRGSRLYNRTPVTTYYRSKGQGSTDSPFKEKPARGKSRRKYLYGIADILLILILLLGLLNSLLVSSNPKVSASDYSYRSASEYRDKVITAFSGFNNRNKISFDENGITKKIESQLPEVEAVQIELPFLSQQPKTRLVISSPAFRLNTRGHSYVVDTQGVVVSQATDLPKLGKLVSVDDQSGFEAEIGKQVLSSQSVGFIDTLIKQCQRAKIPVSSLVLPVLPQELNLKTADQPYYVKFYLGGDANIEVGQFIASRDKFAESGVTPAEYLDVRVAGKIFYK